MPEQEFPERISADPAARGAGPGALFLPAAYSVAVNILILSAPLFALQVYDRVLNSRSVETLLALLILLGITLAIVAVLDHARRRLLARFGEAYVRDMLADIRSSDQASPSAVDLARTVGLAFQKPAILALADLPWVPVFAVALALFHPLLAAVGCLAIVLACLPVALQVFRRQQVKPDQVADWANTPPGEFGDRQKILQNIADDHAAKQTSRLRLGDWSGAIHVNTLYLRLFLQSALIAAGAFLVIGGEISTGAILASSVLMSRMLAPLDLFVQNFALLKAAHAARKQVNDLRKTPRSPVARHAGTALLVRDVTVFSQGRKTPILRAVGATFEAGQAHAIIGSSCSGKSSLLRLLAGADAPAGGSIHWPVISVRDHVRRFGYLPQQTTLLTGTLLDNVTAFDPDPDQEALRVALRLTGVDKVAAGIPDGLDCRFDGTDSHLAHSARRRMGLARAIYDWPHVLLLDDPGASLDVCGQDQLIDIIDAFRDRGHIVLIATHQRDLIAHCDRILRMEKGRIIEVSQHRAGAENVLDLAPKSTTEGLGDG